MRLPRHTSSTFVLGVAGLLAGAIGCADSPDTDRAEQGVHAEQLQPADPLEPVPSDPFAPLTGACPTVATNINQSLVVTAATHPGLASRFTFARVMQQILDTGGGVAPQDKLSLYQTWMATYGGCGPDVDPNGYGIQCVRAPEAQLARVDPYLPNDRAPFTAIALFNRFDLTPQTGETCGEHRIVFAVPPAGGNLSRAFIIFEAALPNPRPDLGVDGCYAVTRFWQSLSGLAVRDRLDQLETFYFRGIVEPITGETIGPVVTAQNYGLAIRTFGRLPPIEEPGLEPVPLEPIETGRLAGAESLTAIGGRAMTEHRTAGGQLMRYGGTSRFGQIRTNMFVGRAEWNLREFKMLSDCTTGSRNCILSMEHVTVASNPAEELFDNGHANSPAWQDSFINQLAGIAGATDANDIGLGSEDHENEFESVSQRNDTVYRLHTGASFRTDIQTELTNLGSALTPNNSLDRATTQTCAGCHELSNSVNLGGGLVWPNSAGFVHITEAGFLSPALTGTFLPRRRTVLDKFIASRCGSIIIGPITPIDEERTVSGAPVGSSN